MACTPYTNTPYGFAMVVSSTTRPTTAPDLAFGRVIAEADTGRVLFYDGTGWVCMSEPVVTTWVPTWTNVTMGASVSTGWYHREDGFIDFQATLTLGAGFAITGNIALTTPVAFAAYGRYSFSVVLSDVSVNTYRALTEGIVAGGTTLPIYATGTGTGTGQEVALNTSATVPFTWAVPDSITVSGRARMNTRYL